MAVQSIFCDPEVILAGMLVCVSVRRADAEERISISRSDFCNFVILLLIGRIMKFLSYKYLR